MISFVLQARNSARVKRTKYESMNFHIGFTFLFLMTLIRHSHHFHMYLLYSATVRFVCALRCIISNPKMAADRTNAFLVMEVDRYSTDDDIRAAYKRLCLLRHPDKGGSHKAFNELSDAKEFSFAQNSGNKNYSGLARHPKAIQCVSRTCRKASASTAELE